MKYIRHEEAVDNPYPYRLEGFTARKTQASFSTDDGRVGFISIEGFSDKAFVRFSVDMSEDVTGLGDQFRILATVFVVLRRFMDKFTYVNLLSFYSYPESRTKVYLRLFKKFLPDFDAEFKRAGSGNFVFSVNRKQLSFPLESKSTEQRITETFDRPYPYSEITAEVERGSSYLFTTEDGRRVIVSIRKRGEAAIVVYDVDVNRDTEDDAFRILATVMTIIAEFMNANEDIGELRFASYGNYPSRVKLYDRLVKKYASGYRLSKKVNGYDVEYRLKR